MNKWVETEEWRVFLFLVISVFFLVDISPDAELITAYYLSESIIHVNFN